MAARRNSDPLLVAITGAVVGGQEAVIPLMVVGSRGHATRIRAVIDTGFTGHLTLPHDIVRDLDLPLLGSRYVTLADGVTVSLDVHRATVLWHGGEHRPVRAFVAHGDALVGMALLRGSEIRIEAADGGEVAIRPLT